MLRQSGFTLIEVLVAMAIVAVSLAAVSRAAIGAIDTSANLKSRVIADWVAQNRLESHQAKHDWLAPGVLKGEETQAGVLMLWKEKISDTPNPAFRKVVVEVYAADDKTYVLRRLVGFLANPPRQ